MRALRQQAIGRLLLVLQLAATAGAVVFLAHGLDVEATLGAFRDADYGLLPLGIALLLADLGLRAVRWRLLLAPQPRLSLSNLFGTTNVGYLVNNILPFRAGEVARVLAVDQLERTGRVRAAASIAVERGIDVMAMVVLLAVLVPFVDEPGWARGPARILGLGVLGGFVALALVAGLDVRGRAFWRPLLKALPRISARLEYLADQTLAGFQPLLRWQILVPVLILTAAIWTCAALSFYTIMIAFNLHAGLAAAALVLSATTLGMVVPSSPGYIGVFHAIVVETLFSVFGVPKERGLTYALAQHAVIVLVPSALGVGFLLRRRGMMRELAASLRGRGAGWPPERVATPVVAEGAATQGGVDA